MSQQQVLNINDKQLNEKIYKYIKLYNEQLSKPPKARKSKKKQAEEAAVASIVQEKKQPETVVKKFKTFRVSDELTVEGAIYFSHDSKNYTLGFNIINNLKGSERNYGETLFIPISINFDNILNKIRHNLNTIISDSSLSDDDLLEYKRLLQLSNELNNIKSDIINLQNIKYSDALITENQLVSELKTLYNKIRLLGQSESTIEEKKATIREYLKLNQLLNHTIDNKQNQIILPGARVLCFIDSKKENFQTGIIDDIDVENNQYIIKLEDGSIVTKNKSECQVQQSIRNSLGKLRPTAPNHLNLKINEQTSDQISNIDYLLYHILEMEINRDDLLARPKIEKTDKHGSEYIVGYGKRSINILDKPLVFLDIYPYEVFDKRAVLTIGSMIKPSSPGKFTLDTLISNKLLPPFPVNWRSLLSLGDTEFPFEVDGFRFKTIKHYYYASRYYNRTDLHAELRNEYNDFFTLFSLDNKEATSFADLSLKDLSNIIDTTSFKKIINWEYPPNDKSDSISSIYLKKAYYNKFNQNKELKDLLISTFPYTLVERLSKYNFKINYELMFVRYYLMNNIEPGFISFNYNPDIKKRFTQKEVENMVKGTDILLKVFVDNNAYENKENFLDNTVLVDEYLKNDVEGLNDETKITEIINKLLYNHNADYIYEQIYDYISTSKGGALNIDNFMMINNNDSKYKNDRWIVQFYYNYIVEKLKVEHSKISQLSAKLKLTEQMLKDEASKNTLNSYNVLKTILRTAKFILIDVPLVEEDSLYYAVVENLVRGHYFPFNFKNNDDKRRKMNNKTTVIKNKIIDENDYEVYTSAKNSLKERLLNLFILNGGNQSEFTNLTILDILELVSRLMCINVRLISSDHNVEIKFLDVVKKIPINIPKLPNYKQPIGCIVLGNFDGYYYPTRPDYSVKTEVMEYLIDVYSGLIIKEDAKSGKHIILGQWDKQNYILDTDTEKIDKEALLGKDVEVESFIVYRIDNMIFYRDRQLYL